MEKRTIDPWTWQDPFGFVQANEVRGATRTLVCAGQTANEEGKPMHAGDMRAQIEYTMDNLEKVLAKGGFELSDVVRLNYYTTDVLPGDRVELLDSAQQIIDQLFASTGIREKRR